MKIVSWNVNGIRACASKNAFKFLLKEGADIYCFQEVKAQEITMPFLFEGFDQFHAFAKKKGYSGVSVYSKIKPISVKVGIGTEEIDEEGRVITLEFPSFFLVNAYFPHAHRELKRLNFKLNFNNLFSEFCSNLEKWKPVIIASDFNVAHKEIDLRNPKSNVKNAGFTQSERDWFDNFLKEGHVDMFREFVKEGENYTWWPYMNNARERNIGWRIDYFVVSKAVRDKVLDSKILKQIIGSDHCPISLELI